MNHVQAQYWTEVSKKMEQIRPLEEGQTYAVIRGEVILFTSTSKQEIAKRVVLDKNLKWAVLFNRKKVII